MSKEAPFSTGVVAANLVAATLFVASCTSESAPTPLLADISQAPREPLDEVAKYIATTLSCMIRDQRMQMATYFSDATVHREMFSNRAHIAGLDETLHTADDGGQKVVADVFTNSKAFYLQTSTKDATVVNVGGTAPTAAAMLGVSPMSQDIAQQALREMHPTSLSYRTEGTEFSHLYLQHNGGVSFQRSTEIRPLTLPEATETADLLKNAMRNLRVQSGTAACDIS